MFYKIENEFLKCEIDDMGAQLHSLVSKDDVQLADLDEFFEKRFEGSLPAFVAAFGRHQNLSDEEMQVIQRIIQHGDK